MKLNKIVKRVGAGFVAATVLLCTIGTLPATAEADPVFVENWGIYDADTNPDGTLTSLGEYGFKDIAGDDTTNRVIYGEPEFATRRDGAVWTGKGTDTTNNWYIKTVPGGVAARAVVNWMPVSIGIDKKFDTIKKLTFTLDMTNSDFPALGALRIYTNKEKSSYLEFGVKGWRPSSLVWSSDNISTAYVKVVKEGAAMVQLHNANVGSNASQFSFGGNVINHFMPNKKIVEWTIITDGERIGWEAFATGKTGANNGKTVAWRASNYLDGFADRGSTPTTTQSNIPQQYDAANNRYNFDKNAKFNQDYAYNDADYDYMFSKAESYSIEFIASGDDDVAFKELKIWDQGAEQRPVNICINAVQHKSAVNGEVNFGQKNGAEISGIVSPSLANKTVTLTKADGETISATLNASGEWLPAIDEIDTKYSSLTFPDGITQIPEDLMVYAIMGDTALDIAKTGVGEEPQRYDIYAVKGITVFGGEALSVDDENLAVADDENYNIYGTAEGEVDITYSFAGGGTLTRSVRIVGAMTSAIESGDPEVMKQYLAGQQEIIDDLNQAAKDNDIAALKEFFSVVQPSSVFNIDAVNNRSLLEIDDTVKDENQKTELDYFAERVAAADKEYRCSSIDDIKEIEQALLKELYTGKLCNLAAPTEEDDAVKTAIDENNSILKLPTDNEYYIECEKPVNTILSNTQFTCYDNLLKTFKDAYVMEAYKKAGLSDKYLKTMLDKCAEEIGYDADIYSKIKDKTLLAKALLDADITTVEELKSAIDNYKEPEEDKENDTKPTTKPSSGHGGGGGGGGGIRFEEKEDVLPETKPDTEPVVDKAQLFDDVPDSHWGYEAIRYLNAIGAASGYGDGTFVPDASVTRAEFLKLSLTAAGIEAPETTEAEDGEIQPIFNDVDINEWYYPFVKAAADAGILKGDNQNNANPDAQITREEAAVILHRIMTSRGKALATINELIRFADADEISDWAVYAISELQVGGVINGDNGAMRPLDSVTRAESAKMIYELVQRETEVTVGE